MQEASTAPIYATYKDEVEVEIKLESLRSGFYKVAEWIARNRSALDTDDLYKMVKLMFPLDATDELNLWDNLFYQVITQKSFYVKEAVMQALVLQNLLKQIAGLPEADALKFLSVIANAKVVLPKILFANELNNSSSEAKVGDDEKIFLNKELFDAQSIQSSKNSIDNFGNLIEELQILQKN